jgi:hypothetical protein
MEGLEHEANALGAQTRATIFVQGRQVGAGERYASGSRRIEARQQRQQRGFARAGCTHDGN